MENRRVIVQTKNDLKFRKIIKKTICVRSCLVVTCVCVLNVVGALTGVPFAVVK